MNINILVCYHRLSPIIANEILTPILLGADSKQEEKAKLKAICQNLNARILLDDVKDNISHLNPYFCELTAMYFAWKNIDADYYGLFHYRRILDFSNSYGVKYCEFPLKEKISFDAKYYGLAKKFYDKYALSQKAIATICKDADIILPQKVIDHSKKHEAYNHSMYELYDKVHYRKDLDLALEVILSKYPQMQEIALETLHKKPLFWHIANMFVMKKELFFDYCKWLFDILFTLQNSIEYKAYDSYQGRVFGFLSERLFNIYIEYLKTQNKHLKIKELPLVLLKYKPKKRWLGWVVEHNVKRFYICKIRVKKQYL